MNRSATIVLGLTLVGRAFAGEGEAALPSPAGEGLVLRLSVEEAIRLARSRSPRLARLRALAEASEEARREIASAGRPLLQLVGGYRRDSDVPELRLSFPGGPARTIFPNIPDNFRSRLQLSLPLYTGGRLDRERAGAAEEGRAARAEVEAAEADLALETATAYWELVTARETARVLETSLAAYERHLADARNAVEVGLAARSDLLAVDAERAHAELLALEARSAARIAESRLLLLVGGEPGTRIEPVEPLAEEEPERRENLEELVARALASRPERQRLLRKIAAARARAEAARAGSKPTLELVAGYDYANPNRRILPAEPVWRTSWDAGVSVAWTVFDSGRVRAASSRAEALARAVERELEELDREIRLEVTERFLELEEAEAAVLAARRGVDSAAESRRVSADRTRQGIAPSSELLDAEVAELRAGLEWTRALAAVRLARARLARAVSR